MQKRWQKRAEIEVQFNLSFVLIVGAIIIIFFVNLSGKQKEVSSQKLSADLLTSLEVIVTGQSVSVGRSSTLEMPPITIGFTCDSYQILTQSKAIGNVVVFAPEMIKGPKMITWTLDWGLRAAAYSSFKAANFVYLTSSNRKYYFVRDDPSVDAVIEVMQAEMPKDININVVTSAEIRTLKFENNYAVTFVFFSLDPIFPDSFRRAQTDMAALKINFNNAQPTMESLNGIASVSFYTSKDSAWVKESNALPFGKEAFYGALFSSNAEQFTCNMEKALQKLSFVAQVYLLRAQALQPNLAETCKADFADGINDFTAVKDTAKKGVKMAGRDVTSLYGAIESLKHSMTNLKLNSCPVLY